MYANYANPPPPNAKDSSNPITSFFGFGRKNDKVSKEAEPTARNAPPQSKNQRDADADDRVADRPEASISTHQSSALVEDAACCGTIWDLLGYGAAPKREVSAVENYIDIEPAHHEHRQEGMVEMYPERLKSFNAKNADKSCACNEGPMSKTVRKKVIQALRSRGQIDEGEEDEIDRILGQVNVNKDIPFAEDDPYWSEVLAKIGRQRRFKTNRYGTIDLFELGPELTPRMQGNGNFETGKIDWGSSKKNNSDKQQESNAPREEERKTMQHQEDASEASVNSENKAGELGQKGGIFSTLNSLGDLFGTPVSKKTAKSGKGSKAASFAKEDSNQGSVLGSNQEETEE